MKTTLHSLFKISAFLLIALTFSACGQKGPLEIEQPVQVPRDEQAPTI